MIDRVSTMNNGQHKINDWFWKTNVWQKHFIDCRFVQWLCCALSSSNFWHANRNQCTKFNNMKNEKGQVGKHDSSNTNPKWRKNETLKMWFNNPWAWTPSWAPGPWSGLWSGASMVVFWLTHDDCPSVNLCSGHLYASVPRSPMTYYHSCLPHLILLVAQFLVPKTKYGTNMANPL